MTAAKPITTKTVWHLVHEAGAALGLKGAVSPHDFRRYIATSLLSEGMPLESVDEPGTRGRSSRGVLVGHFP